ncbi:MAG: HAD hydrolase-like protein [Nanoarchaeota archaeon]|jgi:FMN phosphatase YigB (HAD superfamily)|nr:HAD hydrolase-like protein [Nanoarchaeota archaeon]
MENKIKDVFFDLDGVYFKRGTKEFLDNVSEIYNVDRDKVVDVYLKSEMMQKYKIDEISGDEYWNWVIAELGIDFTKEELLNLLKEGYERNEGAIKLLHKIKALGLSSVICSNNFKERVDVLQEKFNFLNDFDCAIFSYKEKEVKPDLLEKVPGIVGLESSEILFMDDREVNVERARKIGYTAIWCNDSNKHVEDYLSKVGIIF